MSTLQVANLHFESTANNRIQYGGSNSFSLYAGGVNVLTSNSTITYGNIGAELINTISVSSLSDTANVIFSNLDNYKYFNYLIVFSGVNANNASDTRWRGSISADNGSTFTTIGTNLTDNARLDRYLDGFVEVSVARLTANLATCRFSGLTGISGSATGTTDVSYAATVYGSNTVTDIRLYSPDAGRGFGTVGTIYFYGYNKIV